MKAFELIAVLQALPVDANISIENGQDELEPVLAASVISYKADNDELVYVISSSHKEDFSDELLNDVGFTFLHSDVIPVEPTV